MALAILACCATVPSFAQEETFRFGPPLRSSFLFAYKYTERVTTVHTMVGGAADSSERVLTYYITQHQFPTPGKNGLITVQANVDSMSLEFTEGADRLTFNTQRFVEQDWKLSGHREVLIPSSLVNRLVTFSVSPYGEILGMESEDLEDAKKQAADPGVDEFTRTRLQEITTDAYLASVLFPWRMLPLGRTVGYGRPVSVPLWMAMDRISFRGDGTLTLMKSPSGEPKAHFEGRLAGPVLAKLTVAAFGEPLTVKSATASVAGEMELEADGVVHSGWIAINGTASSMRDGRPVETRIKHEVYVEAMGVSPFNNY